MPKLNDLTGLKFGRLLVKSRYGTNQSKRPTWECVCDCGNVKILDGSGLVKGTTKSCGCLRKELLSERSSTHGMRKTRFYEIWYAMKRRCENENNSNYDYYGGRGISVCDRWQKFENFKEDMYESYQAHVVEFGEKQTTLDRINTNGNYSLDNTRWATYITQNRNTRIRKDNRTGHKGVWQQEPGAKYQSYIKVDKEHIPLGTFDNKEDAIRARVEAEKRYWGGET